MLSSGSQHKDDTLSQCRRLLNFGEARVIIFFSISIDKFVVVFFLILCQKWQPESMDTSYVFCVFGMFCTWHMRYVDT